MSEYHVIFPAPNVKAEGPLVSSVPLKDASAPAALGNQSLSFKSVEKEVAAMLLPMASEFGVMVHDGLMVDEVPVK